MALDKNNLLLLKAAVNVCLLPLCHTVSDQLMSALYNAKYHTSFLENKIGMSCIPRVVLSAS